MTPVKAAGLLGAGVALLFMVLSVAGGSRLQKGDGWEARGSTTNGSQIMHFVAIDAAHVQSRATYDEALQRVCPNPSASPICRVAFYGPGDPMPPDRVNVTGSFLPEGYRRILALYSTGGSGQSSYDRWDCERAGSVGAPVTALCGRVGGNHGAVAAVATRASYSVGCG